MFAKEAVRKICSLFVYCSPVAPKTLSDQDNLRKTLSQMGRDRDGPKYIQNKQLQGIHHTFLYKGTTEK